ncbi:MAG: hypothetical protein ACON3Z_19495 [Bradymonadia bacterium]
MHRGVQQTLKHRYVADFAQSESTYSGQEVVSEFGARFRAGRLKDAMRCEKRTTTPA